MDVAAQAVEVNHRLAKRFPDARIMLDYDTDFHLVVAVILSAQCTDKRVNLVTATLFPKYPTVEAFASADIAEFEQDIRSTGFYHNKAKNVLGAAQRVLAEYVGRVPDTMQELLTLPGVARKTANVVLCNLFGSAEGIAVDTHVLRLSKRLGLSQNKDAVKVEKDLMELLPTAEWCQFTYRMIEHGRATCDAKRPICGDCVLSDICPSAFNLPGWREHA